MLATVAWSAEDDQLAEGVARAAREMRASPLVDRRYDERQQQSGRHVLTVESALDILADTHGRDQMRAATPGLRSRRLDVGVLEVPGQEGRHAVRVAHVNRDQPAPLRRVGMVPRRPRGLRAWDTDQPVPRGIQTPAHSAPRATDGRQVVVETHPGLRITGPASVRDGQRRRQSFDELVTIGHDRIFERMLRTLQLRPTGSHGGRNAPGTDERPGHPRGAEPASSSGPAPVALTRQADVAQLVERCHGKAEVSGSIPDVGSPPTHAFLPQCRLRFSGFPRVVLPAKPAPAPGQGSRSSQAVASACGAPAG